MHQFRLRCFIASQKKTFEAKQNSQQQTAWKHALSFFMLPKDATKLVRDYVALTKDAKNSNNVALLEKPICLLTKTNADEMIEKSNWTISNFVKQRYSSKKLNQQHQQQQHKTKPTEVTNFQNYIVENV